MARKQPTAEVGSTNIVENTGSWETVLLHPSEKTGEPGLARRQRQTAGRVSSPVAVGDLNDLRAILGNDTAIRAYRDGTLPFPDGTIIARPAWDYAPSQENDKVFGHPQSFVAGAPKEGVRFMVKDSAKYASTGSWGFAQFNDGKPVDAATLRLRACFPCHEPAKQHDFIYTRYAP